RGHDRRPVAPGRTHARGRPVPRHPAHAEALTALALGLVLFSAFLHAGWNYLLKKSGGGAGLVTASNAASLVIWAPLAAGLIAWRGYEFQPIHLALMAGSGLIHTAYFLFLDRA